MTNETGNHAFQAQVLASFASLEEAGNEGKVASCTMTSNSNADHDQLAAAI